MSLEGGSFRGGASEGGRVRSTSAESRVAAARSSTKRLGRGRSSHHLSSSSRSISPDKFNVETLSDVHLAAITGSMQAAAHHMHREFGVFDRDSMARLAEVHVQFLAEDPDLGPHAAAAIGGDEHGLSDAGRGVPLATGALSEVVRRLTSHHELVAKMVWQVCTRDLRDSIAG